MAVVCTSGVKRRNEQVSSKRISKFYELVPCLVAGISLIFKESSKLFWFFENNLYFKLEGVIGPGNMLFNLKRNSFDIMLITIYLVERFKRVHVPEHQLSKAFIRLIAAITRQCYFLFNWEFNLFIQVIYLFVQLFYCLSVSLRNHLEIILYRSFVLHVWVSFLTFFENYYLLTFRCIMSTK